MPYTHEAQHHHDTEQDQIGVGVVHAWKCHVHAVEAGDHRGYGDDQGDRRQEFHGVGKRVVQVCLHQLPGTLDDLAVCVGHLQRLAGLDYDIVHEVPVLGGRYEARLFADPVYDRCVDTQRCLEVDQVGLQFVEFEEIVPSRGLAYRFLDRHALDLDVLEVRLIVYGDPEQDLEDEAGTVGHIDDVHGLVLPRDEVAECEELLQTHGYDGGVRHGYGDGVCGELLASIPPFPRRRIDEDQRISGCDFGSGSFLVIQSGRQCFPVEIQRCLNVIDLLDRGVHEVDPDVILDGVGLVGPSILHLIDVYSHWIFLTAGTR